MKLEGEASLKTILRNLRDGCKWVSASGIKVSVAGLLGIAGIVFAIRDGRIGSFGGLQWLPERRERPEKLCFVPGLQNLGNNCFLNVILQALASCLCFPLYLHKVIEGCESSALEEGDESLPLTIALASLLEDLSTVSQGRVVLNPRKVMLAMYEYIPNFNLTSQQDADEAFLHLLSSLREEFSDCYRPNHTSLADFSANCRIIAPKKGKKQHDQERWQQHFLGPFDGVVSSILTCQTCSSQISLEFQFFHSLPLSPVNRAGDILAGNTLEDCLRQFFVAEHLENYRCSHCWHIAAVKYLSAIKANKMEIQEVQRCSEEDSCDCRNLIGLQALPWSNKFSFTLKQLNIARSPKVLCLHIQRTSVNAFGEVVKLQGHVRFPMVLNLFPFVKSVVGLKNSEEAFQRRGQVKLQTEQLSFTPIYSDMKFDTTGVQNPVNGLSGGSICSRSSAADESQCCDGSACSIQGLSNSIQGEAASRCCDVSAGSIQGLSNSIQGEAACSSIACMETEKDVGDKVGTGSIQGLSNSIQGEAACSSIACTETEKDVGDKVGTGSIHGLSNSIQGEAACSSIACLETEKDVGDKVSTGSIQGPSNSIQGEAAFSSIACLETEKDVGDKVGTGSIQGLSNSIQGEAACSSIACMETEKDVGDEVSTGSIQGLSNSIQGESACSSIACMETEKDVGDEVGTGSIQGLSNSIQGEAACSSIACMETEKDVGDKMNVTLPSQTHLYRLVSVVEHFGRDGRGHYTVYRSAKVESKEEGLNEQPEVRWFCISDSEVYNVPELDVLAAEASLLFYERIEN